MAAAWGDSATSETGHQGRTPAMRVEKTSSDWPWRGISLPSGAQQTWLDQFCLFRPVCPVF